MRPMQFSRDVLPPPLGPRIIINSPVRIEKNSVKRGSSHKLIKDSAWTGSSRPGKIYDFDNSRMEMTGLPSIFKVGGSNMVGVMEVGFVATESFELFVVGLVMVGVVGVCCLVSLAEEAGSATISTVLGVLMFDWTMEDIGSGGGKRWLLAWGRVACNRK